VTVKLTLAKLALAFGLSLTAIKIGSELDMVAEPGIVRTIVRLEKSVPERIGFGGSNAIGAAKSEETVKVAALV
jgi:hypothetical protein